MNPVTRFDALASQYSQFRPSYPKAFLDWFLGRLGGSNVCDLGAGTGILSRQVLEEARRKDQLVNLTLVEPNASMLGKAMDVCGGWSNVDFVQATAERIPLASSSQDALICAQAFHWFQFEDALAQVARVVRPGGLSCVLWNDRNLHVAGPGIINQALESLLHKHSRTYSSLTRPEVCFSFMTGKPADN